MKMYGGNPKEFNIRKFVTLLANASLSVYLLTVGVFAMFGPPLDRDMIMYVAAALSTLAGTCNGYYFGYNHAQNLQDKTDDR